MRVFDLKIQWYGTLFNYSHTIPYNGLDIPPGYGVFDFTRHDFVLPFLREEILV